MNEFEWVRMTIGPQGEQYFASPDRDGVLLNVCRFPNGSYQLQLPSTGQWVQLNFDGAFWVGRIDANFAHLLPPSPLLQNSSQGTFVRQPEPVTIAQPKPEPKKTLIDQITGLVTVGRAVTAGLVAILAAFGINLSR